MQHEEPLPILRSLLRAKASLHDKDRSGDTALHLALRMALEGENRRQVTTDEAHVSDIEICATVSELLSLKADVHAVGQKMQTPLHICAEGGFEETGKVLMQRGAVDQVEDVLFQQPIHLAASSGRVHFVAFLLKQGTPLHSTVRDQLFRMPLHYAAGHGHLFTVEALTRTMLEVRPGGDVLD